MLNLSSCKDIGFLTTRILRLKRTKGKEIGTMYLFNTAWGIVLALLITMLLLRGVVLGAYREGTLEAIGLALLIVCAGWFVLGTFPQNLFWLWDLLKWINYDILISGMFVISLILIVVYRVKDDESLRLIYSYAAGVTFAYLFIRVAYIFVTGRTSGLLAFLF